MQMPAVAYSWSRKLIDLSCELTQHMHKHKGHGRGSETWQPLTFCYQSEQEAGRRLKATCYAHFQLRAFTVRADAWVKNNCYLTYIGYEDRCLVIGCPSQLRFELGGASNAHQYVPLPKGLWFLPAQSQSDLIWPNNHEGGSWSQVCICYRIPGLAGPSLALCDFHRWVQVHPEHMK